MAKNKTLCDRFAQVQVNGKNVDSKLHKELLRRIPNRPVANLVYGMYLQQGVSDSMDQAGYQKNTQGQHPASAVLEFFKFQNIVTDILDSSIRTVELSKGVREANNKLHNFTDPMDAYTIAKEINEMKDTQGNSRHLAATVVKHGNEFQVLVDPISTNTNLRARRINDALFLWDSLKNAMGLQSVDMDALRVPFSDVLSMGTGMINYIESIAQCDNKYLTQREIQFLLAANENSHLVQSLVGAFGNDIVATSQAVYDNYHVSADPNYSGLIDRAINSSKKLFSVLDDNFNEQTIRKVALDTAASEEQSIKDTVSYLNHKYGIDFTEININEKHSKSLSDATARAIAILEKRINQLETKASTQQDKDNIKKLSQLHDTLIKELENKRYYMGILNYLNEAYDIVTKLEDDLTNRPQNGTPYENATALASILANQNIYVDGYANLFRDLLSDLSDIDSLAIDENISQSDIDNIKTLASNTYKILENVQKRGEELSRDCARDILSNILGDSVGPEVIEQIVDMNHVQNWGMDILYSFGKLSDSFSAAIGDMVRSAQDDRDAALLVYTNKIREATAKLYDSGYNSEFMYEDDGHIISDYDWAAYQKAWSRAKQSLISQGIKGFDLEEAMELWEEANTESIPVDKAPDGTIRRTERVPKLSLYRKAGKSFRDRLTPEQLEYYDTMMQIKGEIGSLLPEWAQNQFLPPQLRRDLVTAATQAIKGEGMKKFGDAFADKLEEIYKIKQDDTEWNIGGEKPASYQYAKGDLAGNKLNQIPIFFVNKLHNGDELFKNFSAGLQALAATAENYHHMSKILDMAEFLRTYIKNTEQKVGEEVSGSKKFKISSVVKDGQGFIRSLVLNNMYDKHFYNITIKGNPFFANVVKSLVQYTSFKGLSTNIFGATANLLVGEQQLFQMALGNTLYKVFTKSKTPYFGLSDWAIGTARLFGAVGEAAASTVTGKNIPSVLLDLITNNKQSMDYLLAEKFNLFNDNYGSMMHTNYHKGFRQLIHNIAFILYGAGEKAIRYNTLWAMMRARKVKQGNKVITLRGAFIKKGYYKSPHLEYKADIYDINGEQITDSNGELTTYGEQFMKQFTKDLRYCCQGMFGAMNDEDKGIIHMHAIGKASMNFRQWMVAHYSERFRGVHWDMDKHEFVRGYWTSSGKFIKEALTTEEAKDFLEYGQKIKFMGQFFKDLLNFRKNWIKEWTKSSETQKLDLARLMSAVITYALLFGSACWVAGTMVPKLWMGDKDDEKEAKKQMSPEKKFIYYQLKRLLFDAESSTPIGAFVNFENLVKSPIPAIRTFDNSMYFLTGLGDLGTPLQSGPDKGMDKYWRNVLKYNMPFWRDYRRIMEFSESDAMFGMFEDQQLK